MTPNYTLGLAMLILVPVGIAAALGMYVEYALLCRLSAGYFGWGPMLRRDCRPLADLPSPDRIRFRLESDSRYVSRLHANTVLIRRRRLLRLGRWSLNLNHLSDLRMRAVISDQSARLEVRCCLSFIVLTLILPAASLLVALLALAPWLLVFSVLSALPFTVLAAFLLVAARRTADDVLNRLTS